MERLTYLKSSSNRNIKSIIQFLEIISQHYKVQSSEREKTNQDNTLASLRKERTSCHAT